MLLLKQSLLVTLDLIYQLPYIILALFPFLLKIIYWLLNDVEDSIRDPPPIAPIATEGPTAKEVLLEANKAKLGSFLQDLPTLY